MDVDLSGLDYRLRDTRKYGLMGHAAQRDRSGWRAQARKISEKHGVEQVNDREVSKPRYCDVGKFLGGLGDVQSGTDVSTRVIQQGQPLAGRVLLGDVEHANPYCLGATCLIL